MDSQARMFLVIDTAFNACSVGIFSNFNGVISPLWQRSQAMARGHQEALGHMVAEAFCAAKIKVNELDRIIVTLGPGSFTGLRIGLAFAKGVAQGANVSLVGIGCLSAFAGSDLGSGFGEFSKRLAVIDAGRGVFYTQAFVGDTPLSEPQAFNPSATLDWAHEAIALIGPAAKNIAQFYPKATLFEKLSPDLAALARLGFAAMPPYNTTPIYMREADAKVSLKPNIVILSDD